MSAYHQNVLLERFVAGGGELPHSVVVGIGGDWYEDVKALRRRGCFIERDGDLWRLDLEALPEFGAGGAVDAAHSRSAWEGDGSSPGADPDPQVEGEAVPLFDAPAQPASPYDPSVEAA